jgi:hypothetical protein
MLQDRYRPYAVTLVAVLTCTLHPRARDDAVAAAITAGWVQLPLLCRLAPPRLRPLGHGHGGQSHVGPRTAAAGAEQAAEAASPARGGGGDPPAGDHFHANARLSYSCPPTRRPETTAWTCRASTDAVVSSSPLRGIRRAPFPRWPS